MLIIYTKNLIPPHNLEKEITTVSPNIGINFENPNI